MGGVQMDEKEQSVEIGTDKSEETLLTQWQTCVEMANAVSQRRDTMNNLFVTLNLAIVAAASFIWDAKTIMLLVSGIIVCVVWIFFIRNFRELNRAKFEVINKLEQSLPVSAFSDEWQSLKKSKKYIEGTKLEKVLPYAFCVLYVVIFILITLQRCNQPSISQP
jgi:hypothetical protein